jgi:uncharacterized NAD-dependent epimerase/dehydratase family protein
VIGPERRVALLMHGALRSLDGKMGLGLLRYGPKVSGYEITCVIDRDEVGSDLVEVTGIDTTARLVRSAAEARAHGADTLVIGVATVGGVLPPELRADIVEGLHLGCSLVNGLHGVYADDPEFSGALQPGAWIWDVRREPVGLGSGRGRAREVPGRRVLTVGTDMAVGKMTATIELDLAARALGLRSQFLATGQIGICIAGRGVALDAVRVDFASAAVEQLCLDAGPGHDVLWVEGQGSILHPGSTAWLPLLRGSMPTDLVLVARAGQTALNDIQPGIGIPPLADVIGAYESVAAAGDAAGAPKVRAVALNCGHLDDADAASAVAAAEAETGLPCRDPIRHGATDLVTAILHH